MKQLILSMILAVMLSGVSYAQCQNGNCYRRTNTPSTPRYQQPLFQQNYRAPMRYYGPAPDRGALIRAFQPRGYWGPVYY